MRRVRGRRVAIADAARARSAPGRRPTAFVVVRAGAGIVAVTITSPRGRNARPEVANAQAVARFQAAHVAEVMSRTAWDEAAAGARTDGFTTPVVLRMFAAVYGPAPGVARPAGRRPGGPESGTLTANLALATWMR